MTGKIDFPVVILIIFLTLLLAGTTDLNISVDLTPFPYELYSHRDTIAALDALGVGVYATRNHIVLENYSSRDRIFEIAEDHRGSFTLRSHSVQEFRRRDFYTIYYYRSYTDARRGDYLFKGRIYFNRL